MTRTYEDGLKAAADILRGTAADYLQMADQCRHSHAQSPQRLGAGKYLMDARRFEDMCDLLRVQADRVEALR